MKEGAAKQTTAMYSVTNKIGPIFLIQDSFTILKPYILYILTIYPLFMPLTQRGAETFIFDCLATHMPSFRTSK